MQYTYQDYLEVKDTGSEAQLIQFVMNAINSHKRSDEYKNAVLADEYFRHRNRTIVEFQKVLYKVTGEVVPDNYSANYKLSSNYLFQFTVQLNQYLLGNGVSWSNNQTAKRLGKKFDTMLQKAGKEALVGGVSFGFMNYDHLEVFNLREFAPLYDEENGALMAGIRFWQISNNKPMRAVLYDLDGYIGFIWRDGEGSIYTPRMPYKIKTRTTAFDGTEIFSGENYPTFPIVPFFGINKQSELVGRREQIDCYDLIKSGFANTVDEASLIYWTLTGSGGMKDIDLVKFVERIKTVHAANLGQGQTAESHAVETPYASREALLTRLRDDLYEDFMAMDYKNVASGSVVTAQIDAAFANLDLKADDFEFNVIDFLQGVLTVLGIEDDPTFTRNKIVNANEQIGTLLQAREYLDSEYLTKKILELLGDGDLAEEILKRLDAEDMDRINVPPNEPSNEGTKEGTEAEGGGNEAGGES